MSMLDGLLLSGIALELGFHSHRMWWRWRQPVVLMVVLTIVLGTAVYLRHGLAADVFVVTAISLFRLFNNGRIVKGRMHTEYLRRTSRRTAYSLGLAQLAVLALREIGLAWTLWLPFADQGLWLVILQVAVAALVLASTLRNIYKSRHITNTKHYSDAELPTVSVVLPARNETKDLEECLHSILANDYPKLEIIVLDDCSQAKTAEIIKSFAHKGVRFVKGREPDEHWLAKNQAYEKLLAEATGELVLFSGVDVRFGPRAIRALVTTLLNRQKDMISVMPLRLYSRLDSAFIQPMRYWWELVPPRRFFNRPPVLSTCWLAKRKELKKLGGFAAVSRNIIPEGYFAREFVKHDAYSFIRSDSELAVQTQKNIAEQRATAIRTRYPQLKRRPELVLLLTAAELLFLLGPFVMWLYGAIVFNVPVVALATLACTLLVMTHVSIMHVSNPNNVPLAFVNFPAAVVTELALGYTSMFRYEFGRVDWKDRNICIPVMHVVPKLPSLDKSNA